MASRDGVVVQQVCSSARSNDIRTRRSAGPNSDTFSCDRLDSFLDSLSSKLSSASKDLNAKLSRDYGACAEDTPASCGPSTFPSVPCVSLSSSIPDSSFPTVVHPPPVPSFPSVEIPGKSRNVVRDVDCGRCVTIFDEQIRYASNVVPVRKIKFIEHLPTASMFEALHDLRFPGQLKFCYGSKKDLMGQLVTSKRRKRKGNRLSLSFSGKDLENDVDCDRKMCALPTHDDLLFTYRTAFATSPVPFVYRCWDKFCSCSDGPIECSTKCAAKVQSFRLYMEVKSRNRPMPPLVAENFKSVTRDSCVVDEHLALVAASAVRDDKRPPCRLFMPVSEHMKNKMGCMRGLTSALGNIPTIKHEIDDTICEVVKDMLNFVDRQSCFVEAKSDPDDIVPLCNSFAELDKSGISESSDRKNAEEKENDSPITPTEKVKKKTKRKELNRTIRELRKLINITVTDEGTQEVGLDDVVEPECRMPHCLMGCVCVSLNEKPHPSDHCGNIECIFECICAYSSFFYDPGELAKEERKWHQTAIRKRNEDVEIRFETKAKRQTKAPVRYDYANFLSSKRPRAKKLGDAGNTTSESQPKEIDNALPPATEKGTGESNSAKRSLSSKKILSKTTNRNMLKAAGSQTKPNKPQNNTNKFEDSANSAKSQCDLRRLSLCLNTDAQTMADIFIWCDIHSKYDCNCSNWVVMMRNCNMVCKSVESLSHNSFLSVVPLKNISAKPLTAQLLDHREHCARSAGCIIDYRERNSSGIFKERLDFLLTNDILTYSNSYAKIRPLTATKAVERLDNFPFPSGGIHKYGSLNENTWIPRSSTSAHVDVGKFDLSIVTPSHHYKEEDDVIFVEDEIDVQEIIPKPIKRKVNSGNFHPCFSVYKRQKCDLFYDVDSHTNVIEDSSSSFPDKVFDEESITYPSLPERDETVQSCYDSEVDSLVSEHSTIEGFVSSRTDSQVSGNFGSNLVKRFPSLDRTDSSLPPAKVSRCDSDDCILIKSNTPSPILIEDDDDDEPEVVNDIEPVYVDEAIELNSSSENDDNELDENDSDKQKPFLNDLFVAEPPIDAEDDEYYPTHGLFCMAKPELGYVTVEGSRPGYLAIKYPNASQGARVFQSPKEASDFMNKVVKCCTNGDLAKTDWVVVTRGVLEKFRCKRFNLATEAENEFNPSVTCNSSMSEKDAAKKSTANISPGQTDVVSIQESKIRKKLKKDEPRRVSGAERIKNDRTSPEDTKMETKHFLQSSAIQASSPKVTPTKSLNTSSVQPQVFGAVTSKPQHVVHLKRNVVGTFSNVTEARSFIEKNLKPQLLMGSSLINSQSKIQLKLVPTTVGACGSIVTPFQSVKTFPAASGTKTVMINEFKDVPHKITISPAQKPLVSAAISSGGAISSATLTSVIKNVPSVTATSPFNSKAVLGQSGNRPIFSAAALIRPYNTTGSAQNISGRPIATAAPFIRLTHSAVSLNQSGLPASGLIPVTPKVIGSSPSLKLNLESIIPQRVSSSKRPGTPRSILPVPCLIWPKPSSPVTQQPGTKSTATQGSLKAQTANFESTDHVSRKAEVIISNKDGGNSLVSSASSPSQVLPKDNKPVDSVLTNKPGNNTLIVKEPGQHTLQTLPRHSKGYIIEKKDSVQNANYKSLLLKR